MKRSTLAIVVSAAMASTGSAFAASPSALQLDRAEAAAAHTVPITLAKGIAIAQQQGHGTVLDIVSRPGGRDDLYSVTLIADGRLGMGTVDAVTGAYTPSRDPAAAVSAMSRGERADVATLDQAAVPLARAVATAQRYADGKAGDAGVETLRNGRIAYEVRVLKGDRFADVWVDPASGKVIETTLA